MVLRLLTSTALILGGTFSLVMPAETDLDGDGFIYPVDCNDADPNAFPGAPELCDGIDNDCDSELDEECARACAFPGDAGSARRITDVVGSVVDFSLVWTGRGYGVAWTATDETGTDAGINLFLTRLAPDGRVLERDLLLSESAKAITEPSLVWSGAEFAVAWLDERTGLPQLFLRRVGPDGVPVGNPFQVTGADSDTLLLDPALAWNGSGFGLVWPRLVFSRFEWDSMFLPLDRFGAPLGDAIPLGLGPSSLPNLIWGDGTYGLGFEDPQPLDIHVNFALLSLAGELGERIRLTSEAGQQRGPIVRWTGGEFALSWLDFGIEPPRGFVSVLDPLGNVLVGRKRLSDTSNTSRHQPFAWTGQEYGAAFATPGLADVVFRRVDRWGDRLGDDLLLRRPGIALRPAVAWNGAGYGLVWLDAATRQLLFQDLGCDCPDGDGDSFSACSDCDDNHASTYPGAPQVCDGLNNDCEDTSWPTPPTEDADLDGDGVAFCAGDCDDMDPDVGPHAIDLPGNTVDEDCDGTIACSPTRAWRNRGEFVECVTRACRELTTAGLIPNDACAALVSEAAQSPSLP